MTVVTIQLGQCGNQVGEQIFDTISEEVLKAPEAVQHLVYDTFFRPNYQTDDGTPIARAVLIDMEPKVINCAMNNARKTGRYIYDKKRVFYKQSGSANNWAFGYNIHGPSSRDKILNIVRKEVECCDCFGGFLFLQSLAGGTGSGVGVYITEQLRDEYPSSFMMNQVVWPYTSGEVIVQNYNTLLTLSKLQNHSDCILVFENDQLNLVCMDLLKIERPNFENINKVIARNITSILFPTYITNFVHNKLKTGSHLKLLIDPIRHLCPNPGYKIISLKTTPQISTKSAAFSSFLWPALLNPLYQMLISDSKIDSRINWNIRLSKSSHINKSLSNLLILRGNDLNKIYPYQIEPYSNPQIYTDWAMDPFLLSTSTHSLHNYEKSATLFTNSQSIIQPLSRVIEKAYEMFYAKAYLYQYEKYKIDREEWISNFYQVEQILQNYKNL